MAIGQSSFRRILLTRLLLVSVPVLLMGVYVTYRKARSAFLETARQNLTESAIRKGDSIHESIEALQANLSTASDSAILKLGSPQQQQAFLDRLSSKLPTHIKCVQLANVQTKQVVASTCTQEAIENLQEVPWSEKQKSFQSSNLINVKFLLPKKPTERKSNRDRLELLLSAPVYDDRGQLRYVLNFKSALLEKEAVNTQPGSLMGYTVVLNEAGTILAHPFAERVGRNIAKETDARRLQILIDNAIAGQSRFLHLFAFDRDGVELVAGYSSIPSPVTSEKSQKWIILAVAPIDKALAPLKEIQDVLIGMTIALLVASGLVILYIARELARPLENLRDYAINTEPYARAIETSQNCPQDFKIREFNQLATAIDEMLARLQAWGEEIVSSWREAQNANQLKNEFLATTSHELRTPLNGIINCIRIVEDGYCDSKEEEMDFLQQADAAAAHLLEIINDILDIAKIEAGKLSVSLELIDLSQLLTEVINLQSVPLQKKGLKLKTSQGEKKPIVNADPAKLRQVLLNIIGNAVKFTQSGTITISTHIATDKTTEKASEVRDTPPLNSEASTNDLSGQTSSPTASSSNFVIITVKDTGIGIDPSQQDKLFRPFVMVDGSTTRQFSGTGLGLAISRNLIELMGGSINLYSAGRNKGTTVKIVLPLAEISCVRPANSQETHNGTQKLVAERSELSPKSLPSKEMISYSVLSK